MSDRWKIWLFWLGVIILFFYLAGRPNVQQAPDCQYQWDGQSYVCE